MVAGYSIKARGIAKDIFGTEENYVISVQNFTDKNNLKTAFQWLEKNAKQIEDFLETRMPQYCQKSLIAGEAVKRLRD